MPQDPLANLPKSITYGPGSFFVGATYPLKALALFFKYPQLRSYVLLPILVNLVVGFTVYAGLLWGGLQAIDFFFTKLPDWLPDISQWDPATPTWLHFPQWQVTLPTWLHLPRWQISLPALQWPNWEFTWPNWLHLPQWNFQMPQWVQELPSAGAIAILWLVRTVLIVTLFLVTGFVFLQFGVLLGAPWYGKLSEEIERLRTGSVKVVEVGLAKDVSRAVLYELKKLGLTLLIGLPLLLLQFFPGIGTVISTTGGIILAGTIVCMDFFDAAIERRRPPFRKKLGIVWRSLPASASFALICLGLVSIPLINLLGIPLCVAAGTLFVCDRVLPRLEK